MLSSLNAGNQPTMTSYTGTRRQQHYLFFASGDATYTIELFLGKIGSFESPQMTNHATFAESGIILRFLETLRERLNVLGLKQNNHISPLNSSRSINNNVFPFL